MADAAPDGHALELSRATHTQWPGRILLSKRAPEDVGDDLRFLARPSHRDSARWQSVLAEVLKSPETTVTRVRSLLRVERVPDLLLAVVIEVALVGPTQRDHRPAPLPACSIHRGPCPYVDPNPPGSQSPQFFRIL